VHRRAALAKLSPDRQDQPSTPDGRTTTCCAGIWSDDQVEGHSRVTAIVRRMGAVPAIQLGHTGRKGSELPPHRGTNADRAKKQLPPDHPDGWTCVARSAIPYGGGGHVYPVHALTVDEIRGLHRAYAEAAVRAVWPERYPLTMRLGSDGPHPQGTQFEDSVAAIAMMKDHGLDLADLSPRFNTDAMVNPPTNQPGFMVERANRVRREVGIPVATSWNLGVPQLADRVIREELVDLVMLGRPALSNPHWPVWAARELSHPSPCSLVPDDWRWWLDNFRGHVPSIGWPAVGASATAAESAARVTGH
jgi:2,4-dienoyl-CoA reductase-like NADH-dependent reductase (Old Yellow Enzyme family)